MRKSPPGVSQGPAEVFRKRFFWISLAAIIITGTILLLIILVIGKGGSTDLAIVKDGFWIRPYHEGGLHCAIVSIQNQSNRTSPKFGVHFYRGDPNKYGPMTHSAGPIKPGEVWNERTQPFALKEGVNEILVVLDPYDQVGESDETNNRALLTVVANENKIIKKTLSCPLGKSAKSHK